MKFLIFCPLAVIFLLWVFMPLPGSLSAREPSLYFFQLGLAATVVGLVLFIASFRRVLENLLVFLLFFWEKKFTRVLLRKNLAAHYTINRLQSIIYALAFFSIILTALSFNIATKEFNTSFLTYN